MLPKQEVLKGRAGFSLLFKGENTEGQTAGAGSETLWTSENTASWLRLGQHVLPKGHGWLGPKDLCVPHSPLSQRSLTG